MASLSSGLKLGSGSVSSLIKSAQTMQNEVATYNDTIQKNNFANDPSDSSLQSYLDYLQGRITTLNNSGSITNATKAATMNQDMKTAIASNTSFNVQNESIQVLTGNGTDEQKLQYMQYAFQRAQSVGDVKLAQSIESQAYSLQQSIEYHAQVAQTAATTQAASDLAAQERGFTNGEAALKASWQQMQDAYKNGDQAAIKTAFKTYADTIAPVLKANGVSVPKNATGDMNTAHLGYLIGLAQYYENAAVAAGPSHPDYQGYVNKATATLQGSEFRDALTGAMAPTNITSNDTTYGPNGTPQTTQVTNAISGFHRVQVTIPGLAPVTLNIPTTTGNSQTPYAALGKGNQSSLDDSVKKLGFNILSGTTSSGQLRVSISDKAAKWLGNSGLQVGDRVTLIPTGKGFQFVDANNNLFGVSFDNKGASALFRAGANNSWQKVGGEAGFNANAPGSIANAMPSTFSKVTSPIVSGFEKFMGAAPSNSAPPRGPQMVQRAGGGYNFTNAQGQAISAATYSQLTHTQFRTLLGNMANGGDTGAKTALNFVGNDLGYNPSAIGNNSGLYNSLTWGSGHQFTGATAPNTSGGGLNLPSGLKL